MALYPVFRGVYDECQNVRARKPHGEYRQTAQHQSARNHDASRLNASLSTGQYSNMEDGTQNSYLTDMAAVAASSPTQGRILHDVEHHGEDQHERKSNFLEVANYLDKFFNPKDTSSKFEPLYRGKYCRVGVSSYAIPMNINVIVSRLSNIFLFCYRTLLCYCLNARYLETTLHIYIIDDMSMYDRNSLYMYL